MLSVALRFLERCSRIALCSWLEATLLPSEGSKVELWLLAGPHLRDQLDLARGRNQNTDQSKGQFGWYEPHDSKYLTHDNFIS